MAFQHKRVVQNGVTLIPSNYREGEIVLDFIRKRVVSKDASGLMVDFIGTDNVSFPEAPADNKLYARKDESWQEFNEFIDAPSDSSKYARVDGNWESVNEFPEAPTDNKKYGRTNNSWSEISEFQDAPSDGNKYTRKDGQWEVSDPVITSHSELSGLSDTNSHPASSISTSSGSDVEQELSTKATMEDLTESQNDIVGGSIFKGSNGEHVQNGDVIPAGTTRLRVLINGEPILLFAWDNLTLPATVTSVPTTDNGFAGYDVATDQGTFEFVTENKRNLRESNDILGWFSGDEFDGSTDITSNILAAKAYIEITNSRDIICSKGNAFINGVIELDNNVNVSFGDNKVISGPSMQWIVRKGSNVSINDIRMGEDGLTQNLQPLFLINSEAGPIFLDGQRDTSIKCGIKSEITTGAPFVRLEAKVKSGQTGSSAVTGVDVDVKTNQGRRAVEINADNLADTLKSAFVNSCRVSLKASATIDGIYEIYNSDESILTKPVNCEIAQNNYFIEYQATSGRAQVPLNSLGDRHVIDGQIWDLNIASNLSNVRVRGDACNILSSSFPTEESGRLVVGDGITPNTLGGLGGTQRSRSYSHIAQRTHCKYLGTGRTTNDLINATYAFLVSATDAIISGTDYSDGTIINSKTFPPSQFILNGDISVDYKMIGKPTVGDKFGLGIRINGTTYSTLRVSGLASDGFIAYLTLYMSVNDNRVDIAYKVGGNEKILVSQSVPDLSVNGATIEVYGFSHEGSEPSNRVTIAGLDGLIKYKTA
ncbi:hypothetical protein PQC39_gp122 [Vibrio phage Vp_R1]|uniref:Uncharacterized protein n=1 Tax=Vibrio phage Vp_R1 TaxID=2059867 RepID=A0A2H5BQQ0_9CAUD|nr:hypothetical protein PQC39_gp122 [Vibrio phage Vp_R1]AUG88486.1 hypothetical protein VPR_122 [Vibrio phage Vp_R1]